MSLADLSGANLTSTNLTSTNLTGANLTGADLNNATLHHTNLSLTNLTGAIMRFIKLSGANLTGAVMPKVADNNEVQEILDGEHKGLIERFKKIRWYRVRQRVNEYWFSWLMWGLLGGAFLVGGLREWAGLEIAWWPFGGGGSGECYFMGNVEICS